MNLKVGDSFTWNRRGAIVRVTDIGPKIKFEVSGSCPMTGSMCAKEFANRFLKGKRKQHGYEERSGRSPSPQVG